MLKICTTGGGCTCDNPVCSVTDMVLMYNFLVRKAAKGRLKEIIVTGLSVHRTLRSLT